MASNKHVDLRKIENIVGSKYYPEYISKDKWKRPVSENLVRTSKSLIGILYTKGKEG